MRTKVLGVIVLVLLILPAQVSAHSGRTDSSGGHNCNVGACAGTYHYHSGGGSYTPPTPRQPIISTRTITETKAIYFKTVEQNNKNLAVGKKKTTREGIDGVKTYTYKITYTDGVRTSKDLVSAVTTKNPVSKIVAVGTKTEAKPTATTNQKTPENESKESSTSEAMGSLAAVGVMGYGLYRLGKFGLAKFKGN